RLHNRQQRLQCLPQFIADLLSCHANNNAQPPAFDDLVLLAALRRCGRILAGYPASILKPPDCDAAAGVGTNG
ncbi:hypothetical protein ACI2SX_11095, partial [Ralstonia nicotianae]